MIAIVCAMLFLIAAGIGASGSDTVDPEEDARIDRELEIEDELRHPKPY